jgi:hypothetical protein
VLFDAGERNNSIGPAVNRLGRRSTYLVVIKVLVEDFRACVDEPHEHVRHMDYRVSVMSYAVYNRHLFS